MSGGSAARDGGGGVGGTPSSGDVGGGGGGGGGGGSSSRDDGALSAALLASPAPASALPILLTRHARAPSGGKPSSSDLFDCNICLDTATEPVITMCGHLYCWPCIYKWLELRRESDGAFCPICKAEISSDRMIPVYGRGQRSRVDPRQRAPPKEALPPRPPGQRPASSGSSGRQSGQPRGSEAAQPPLAAAGAQAGAGAPGLGFLPTVLGFQFNASAVGDEPGGEQLSPEQVQQAFLSRLLLLLGSFVILCLLLF